MNYSNCLKELTKSQAFFRQCVCNRDCRPPKHTLSIHRHKSDCKRPLAAMRRNLRLLSRFASPVAAIYTAALTEYEMFRSEMCPSAQTSRTLDVLKMIMIWG